MSSTPKLHPITQTLILSVQYTQESSADNKRIAYISADTQLELETALDTIANSGSFLRVFRELTQTARLFHEYGYTAARDSLLAVLQKRHAHVKSIEASTGIDKLPQTARKKRAEIDKLLGTQPNNYQANTNSSAKNKSSLLDVMLDARKTNKSG